MGGDPAEFDFRAALDDLYAHYNRREMVEPDPLQLVYEYSAHPDREIAGLISSSLAYGQVVSILNSARDVLGRMGGSPYAFITGSRPRDIRQSMKGFKHRWSTGEEMAQLLVGVKRVLDDYATLGDCLAECVHPADRTILPGLTKWVGLLRANSDRKNSLLSAPSKGSACKRMLMYTRWMVRRDEVDPGGWNLSPSLLVVPVDVHMHRVGRLLGFTGRQQANLATALELTEAFRAYAPGDPVRYDFALTRLGIRKDANLGGFFEACRRVA